MGLEAWRLDDGEAVVASRSNHAERGEYVRAAHTGGASLAGVVTFSATRIPTPGIVRAIGDTRPMTFEDTFVAAMEKAVTPSDADVLVARGIILEGLSTCAEPVLISHWEDQWLRAQGVARPSERSKFTALPGTEPGRRLADPDSGDPHLVEFRGRHAVRRALGQLIAEGVVTRGDGNLYGLESERIQVDYPGGASSVSVLVHSPYVGDRGSPRRFIAVRPLDGGDGSEVLLPVEELLAGLDGVLGARGLTLVRESRRALQRGLFLASSSLLAAASEAAWFNLARAVQSPAAALAQRVADGRDVAEVIRLTEQRLRELKPKPGSALITEVVTQAHLFRDVRNYALHPAEGHDHDRETWLTETGATLLAIAARRYFVKLEGLRVRLVAAGEPRVGVDEKAVAGVL